MLQHHDKTRLRSRFVHRVSHAVVERIKVFTHCNSQHELLTNHVKHILLALSVGNVGIQKVLTHGPRRVLQVLHPKSPDRLHDVGANTLQNRLGDGFELGLSDGLTR